MNAVIEGGHTSEALSLLSGLDFARYRPRTYVVSHGDILSAKKAVDFEAVKNPDASPHTVSVYDSLLLVGMTMERTLVYGSFYFSSYSLSGILRSSYHPTRTTCASVPADDPIFIRMVTCGVRLPHHAGTDSGREIVCGCADTKRARYLCHVSLGNVSEQGKFSSPGYGCIYQCTHKQCR